MVQTAIRLMISRRKIGDNQSAVDRYFSREPGLESACKVLHGGLRETEAAVARVATSAVAKAG